MVTRNDFLVHCMRNNVDIAKEMLKVATNYNYVSYCECGCKMMIWPDGTTHGQTGKNNFERFMSSLTPHEAQQLAKEILAVFVDMGGKL